MRKYDCIFFDRDGTINYDPGYISKLKYFNFYDFTIDGLNLFKKITHRFIMVTNQSGVSRGLIKKEDLFQINDFITSKLIKNKIPLLKIYQCTDHPDNATERRKPGTGMFLEAVEHFDLNLEKCLMIGDSKTDIEPASNLGMDSMLVLTGNGKEHQNELLGKKKPTYITENILTGAELLTK